MNKKIAFYLILIILIIFGGFYFFKILKIEKINQEKYLAQIEKENLFVFENKNEEIDADIKRRFSYQFYQAVEEIKYDQKNYLGWAVAGNVKKAVNDLHGAEALYLAGLENIPDNAVLYSNLADLYYHFLEDYQKAEQYYLKTIELKPDHLQSYLDMSILYRVKLKDQDKAISILKQGLEQNPRNKELMVGLANAYKKFDMINEAKEVWQELIDLYPENDLYKKELEILQ
ncbi:tetratricopeptide repeat protein [Patescibacteria group bacterium]|nr:tetratricopeptide repeat protein [Patescibacteria group bacterium]